MEFNKDLIAASSTPIVLAILSEGDSYGYAIIKRVQELSGGHMEWTDGMLYPVLHRLERLGYIKARWEESETGRRRKYYRIMSRGRDQLAEERRQWQTVDATLRGIWKMLSLLLSFIILRSVFEIQRNVKYRTPNFEFRTYIHCGENVA